ncbi:hypothetical protein B0T21DRAFT_134901 [Apiosordaria backusii]|uniref:Secreted protein n=1 Tax=Apiosordaria backusii TaxID=314023 RepID=A0AA40EHX8_9PEZI|nr:hypothetical protein B0T21DRAFT_134901 [Apiosordaria backusii]
MVVRILSLFVVTMYSPCPQGWSGRAARSEGGSAGGGGEVVARVVQRLRTRGRRCRDKTNSGPNGEPRSTSKVEKMKGQLGGWEKASDLLRHRRLLTLSWVVESRGLPRSGC